MLDTAPTSQRAIGPKGDAVQWPSTGASARHALTAATMVLSLSGGGGGGGGAAAVSQWAPPQPAVQLQERPSAEHVPWLEQLVASAHAQLCVLPTTWQTPTPQSAPWHGSSWQRSPEYSPAHVHVAVVPWAAHVPCTSQR